MKRKVIGFDKMSRRLIEAVECVYKIDENMSEPIKILLCLRYGIGDLVMELTGINALKKHFSQSHITGIGSYPAIELLENDLRIDTIVGTRQFDIKHLGDEGNNEVEHKIKVWLEKEKFELIVDLSHSPLIIKKIISKRKVNIIDTDYRIQNEYIQRGESNQKAINAGMSIGWGVYISEESVPDINLHDDENNIVREIIKKECLV
ncbi:MAG: hypothetical protein BWY69_00260 [Planctomycetes bacterium ADurb.Bin401]|nr:MAG: hypothetical protein BWY69_00260 [Planctomycetes bacterium ADurb.Bin401]